MPPKKTASPQKKTEPGEKKKTSKPRTKASADDAAVSAASVRIPDLKLSYENPKASAEVARRVPSLALGIKPRRGWKGPPPPFDTEEGALAWGMKGLDLKGLKAKYTNSKRSVRELRMQLSTAVNKDPAFRKANPIPRVREGGRFTKRPEIPLGFPALSSDSS